MNEQGVAGFGNKVKIGGGSPWVRMMNERTDDWLGVSVGVSKVNEYEWMCLPVRAKGKSPREGEGEG